MTERRLPSPHHSSVRSFLRIGGPLLAVVGLIFAVVGLVDFFSAFGGAGRPEKFWCLFIGLPLFAVGVGMTKFGYMGEILRYVAAETTPVATDAFNEAAEGMQPGIKNIARSITEGVAEGRRSQENKP
jgi:hypothetical protein